VDDNLATENLKIISIIETAQFFVNFECPATRIVYLNKPTFRCWNK